MQGVLDVQRDHPALIRAASRLLRTGGRLVFSTNFSRFAIDAEALADCEIEDISARTIPRDFARHPRIHRAFLIRRRGVAAGRTPVGGRDAATGSGCDPGV